MNIHSLIYYSNFFLHFKVYCVVGFFMFSADMGQFSNFVVLLYEV